MIFDRRLTPPDKKSELKPAELPIDYLKIVEETLAELLKKGLVELNKIHAVCDLKATGAIYTDEVILAITISHGEKSLIATTVYASANFDPSAEEPGIESVLQHCLDSLGAVLSHYLDPEYPDRISQIAAAPISALEEAPFEWTAMEEAKVATWVKIDKSNPTLEALADDWLKKNDPNYSRGDDLEEAEEFLQDRLEAIQKAKTGSGGNSGPIRH